MPELTENLIDTGNIVHSIKKLENAVTIIIDVYNHVENYRKDQNLAEYIADISSYEANQIKFKKQKLSFPRNYIINSNNHLRTLCR